MSKGDWVAVLIAVVLVIGGTIGASVDITMERERTKAADAGNGYWCPKHGPRNKYHYTSKECKHEHNN